MKEYGMTNSVLMKEISDDPQWAAEALAFIHTQREHEYRQTQRASGNYKMGEELHGTKSEVEQWRSTTSARSKSNVAMMHSDMRKKLGKAYDSSGF